MRHKLNLHTTCATNHALPSKKRNIKCVTVEISGNIRGKVRDKKNVDENFVSTGWYKSHSKFKKRLGTGGSSYFSRISL